MHGDFILKLLRTNSDKIKGSSKSEVDSRYYGIKPQSPLTKSPRHSPVRFHKDT